MKFRTPLYTLLFVGCCCMASALGTDHVFVANENIPDTIRELDPSTKSFVRSYDASAWTSAGAGRYLALDNQRRLWVTNNDPWHIYAIGEGGVVLKDYPIVDSGTQVRDIEFSWDNGMLYVVTGNGSRVVEVDPATGGQTTRIDTGFEAVGLGFGPNGDLYVTTYTGGGARVYDPSTFSLIRTISPPPDIVDPRSLGIAFVGEHFYLSSFRGDAAESYIDEYCSLDGAYVGRVGTYGYTVNMLKPASNGSLWTNGPFSGPGAVAEISIATGELLGDVLSQGGLSGAGNSDIEVGRIGICGALDCDGDADAFDIAPFICALTAASACNGDCPCCDPTLADINGDTFVDVFDIGPFIGCLTGTP